MIYNVFLILSSSSLYLLCVFVHVCVYIQPYPCFLHLSILCRDLPLQARFPGILGFFQLNVIIH